MMSDDLKWAEDLGRAASGASRELTRLRDDNARLVEALTEAIYEVAHLSAPKPNDIETLYRPVIKGEIVDGWRKALAAHSTEG